MKQILILALGGLLLSLSAFAQDASLEFEKEYI